MLKGAFPPGNGELRVIEIGALTLQGGAVLPGVSLALQCWGEPTANRDNIVLVEHALTGDSHLVGSADADHPTPGWWDGLVGPGAPLDTDEWCVVAINALGGCRGSTGPASPQRLSVSDGEGSGAWLRRSSSGAQKTQRLSVSDGEGGGAGPGEPVGRAWGSRFPSISIRDQVAAEALLLDRLGVRRVAAVIGGSMGAMRALEWMIGYPERVAAALVLAVGPRATADQIGTQITQIAAITSDPDWQGGDYHGSGRAPVTGMGIARRIAHLTYRTAEELDARFGNAPQIGEDPREGGRYAVQSYLDHQVAKFAQRFDPGTYVVLSEAMNRHDVGFERGGVTAALQRCAVPCLVGGIDSDRLYPLATQQELADRLAGCERLEIIHSPYGHDGFLLEFAAMSKLLAQTMNLARANK